MKKTKTARKKETTDVPHEVEAIFRFVGEGSPLLELLMDRFGWEAVWGPGGGTGQYPWSSVGQDDAWLVGTWTGPQGDLLCVKSCATNEEADRWLSPAGKTILGAATKSVWLLLKERDR